MPTRRTNPDVAHVPDLSAISDPAVQQAIQALIDTISSMNLAILDQRRRIEALEAEPYTPVMTVGEKIERKGSELRFHGRTVHVRTRPEPPSPLLRTVTVAAGGTTVVQGGGGGDGGIMYIRANLGE